MLIPTGVVLGVAGAVLTFAVERSVGGFDLDVAGAILMGAGGFLALAGLLRGEASPGGPDEDGKT